MQKTIYRFDEAAYGPSFYCEDRADAEWLAACAGLTGDEVDARVREVSVLAANPARPEAEDEGAEALADLIEALLRDAPEGDEGDE